MKIIILTSFPEIFSGFLEGSLIGKSISKGILSVDLLDFRKFASPPHYKIDDKPYGGGPGMVLKPEPLVEGIEKAKESLPNAKVYLLSPAGQVFTQRKAEELSLKEEIILVCGRYEGIDQRVIDLAVDEEISIGDFVIMGGEVASMVVIESVARLVPGVLGNQDSVATESFSENILEAPQYTRPPVYRGLSVPDVLLTGNHKEIAQWRREKALEITKGKRPDLLK